MYPLLLQHFSLLLIFNWTFLFLQEARNEKLHTPLNIDQALDARDAVAKALYSSLFSWLVNRVNAIVNKGERALSINILDIFGFEDFPVSFPSLF